MNLVWSNEGISVGSISMNRWEGMQMFTSGFGWDNRNGTKPFQWEATIGQNGWYIIITTGNGKRGEYQGGTFNLPLEIVSAAKRLL